MQLFITDTQEHALALSEALSNESTEHTGYYECGNNVVTWCNGSLFQLAEPETYNAQWKHWDIANLPIIPDQWQWKPRKDAFVQLFCLKKLLRKAEEVVHAGSTDPESQLTIDILLHQTGIMDDPLTNNHKSTIKRLIVDSINIDELKNKLHHLENNSLYRNISQAALCRHITDWLYGINMSRLLTLLTRHNGDKDVHTVGRVQTPMMEMVKEAALSEDKTPFSEKTLLAAMENILPFVKDPLVRKTLKADIGLGKGNSRLHLLHHLYNKDYLRRNGEDIVISQKGEDALSFFPDQYNHVEMTAIWEAKLHTIESGTKNAEHFIREFETDLGKLMSATIYHANCSQNRKADNTRVHQHTPLQVKPDCTECNASMTLKFSNYGAFWSCSNYPDCKTKLAFNQDALKKQLTQDEKATHKTKLSEVLSEQPPCPECHAPLVKREGKYGAFWGCSRFPRCRCNMKDINGTPDIKTYFFGKKK